MRRSPVAVLGVLCLSLPPFAAAQEADTLSLAYASNRLQWGKYEEAEDTYRRLAALPGSPKEKGKIYKAWADLHLKLGDYAAARDVVAQAQGQADAKTQKKLEKKLKKKTKRHRFGGALGLAAGAHDNVGASRARFPESGINEDEEEEEDFAGEDDALDDALEDIEIDDEELEEYEDADADEDGIDDTVDEDIADDDPDAEPAFYKRQGDGDERLDAKAALRYSYLISERGHRWNAGAQITNSSHRDRSELDRVNLAFNTGPVFNFPEWRLQLNPSISYVELSKNDDAVLNIWLASVSAAFQATRDLKLSARYNAAEQDFETQGAGNVEIDTLRFQAVYRLTPKDTLSVGLSPQVQEADNRVKDRDGYAYEFGYARRLPWKLQASAKARFKETEYDNTPQKREDEEATYTIGLTKKLPHRISVGLIAQAKERDSNVRGKSSNAQSVILVTGWKF